MHVQGRDEAFREAQLVGQPAEQGGAACEVSSGPFALTSTRGSGVVAFTCTVILLGGVCSFRQLALSLLGSIFNSPLGAAARALLKNPG